MGDMLIGPTRQNALCITMHMGPKRMAAETSKSFHLERQYENQRGMDYL